MRVHLGACIQTQNYRRKLHRGIKQTDQRVNTQGLNLSECLKIYERDVFLKSNYPQGCGRGVTAAVPSSYQESTHLKAHADYIRCHFDPLQQRKEKHSHCSGGNYTTSCHIQHEFDFTLIFSLMTMYFCKYVISFETVVYMGVYIVLIPLRSM